MPLLSFSGEPKRGPFWRLILNGEKRQTVREPRMNPIKVGDVLKMYWKVRTPVKDKPIHFIGEAICTSVERREYGDFRFDDEFARADGFENSRELREWFGIVWRDEPFDVIHWGEIKSALRFDHHKDVAEVPV